VIRPAGRVHGDDDDLPRSGNMFSILGANECGSANPHSRPMHHPPPNLPEVGPHVQLVPSAALSPALSRIEDLLESIVDALADGRELVIPYRSVRSSQNGDGAQARVGHDRQAEVVTFPARTIEDAKRFGMESWGESHHMPVSSCSQNVCHIRSNLSHP